MPSTAVVAAGAGAIADEANGKPQTGVVFHRSEIAGLLLRLRPTVAEWWNRLACVAYRSSVLSMPRVPLCGSIVTCTNAPSLGPISPARNSDSWSGRNTLKFFAPGMAFAVVVAEAWNM